MKLQNRMSRKKQGTFGEDVYTYFGLYSNPTSGPKPIIAPQLQPSTEQESLSTLISK